MSKYGVELREVEWAIPPDMRYRPQGWCGPKTFLGPMYALRVEGYDAIAYYEHEVEIQADLLPMLRCAASGHIFTTQGPWGEPITSSFFAVPHDKRLLAA